MYRWLATSIALMITSEALAFDVYECNGEYQVTFTACQLDKVSCLAPVVEDVNIRRAESNDESSLSAEMMFLDENIVMKFILFHPAGLPEPVIIETVTYVQNDNYGYQRKDWPYEFLKLENVDNTIALQHIYSFPMDLTTRVTSYSCNLKK